MRPFGKVRAARPVLGDGSVAASAEVPTAGLHDTRRLDAPRLVDAATLGRATSAPTSAACHRPQPHRRLILD